MTTSPAETAEWAGPTRFFPPPEPGVQADGSKRYEGVTYAAVSGYRPLLLDLWVPASTSPPPLVVWVHGAADAVVPYCQSELLEAALTRAGVPVRLVPVEGADHIFEGHDDIDAVVRMSVDYLAAALGGGPSSSDVHRG